MTSRYFAALFLVIGIAVSLPNAGTAQLLPGTPQTDAADPALQSLLDALETPETRDQLIAALKAAQNGVPLTSAEPERIALAARLAEVSIDTANTVWRQITQVISDVGRLRVLGNVLTPERMVKIRVEGTHLLLTILVTVAIYGALRTLSRRIRYAKPRTSEVTESYVGTFLAQFLLRLASVILAWVVGYGLATVIVSDGQIHLPQALYLNAFLIFGLFSVALSVFVSRYVEDLTFARLPGETEAVVSFYVRLSIGVLIYGLVAAVPIALDWTNFVVSRSLRTIVLTVGALLGVITIWRISRAIAAAREKEMATEENANEDDAEDDDTLTAALATSSVNLWDRFWPPLAYLYVFVAYIMAMANPNLILELVGRATGFTALGLISLLFGLRHFDWASQDLRFPVLPTMVAVFPTLQSRLSIFLKPMAVIIGVGFIALALMLVLEGWRLIDVTSWYWTGGAEAIWNYLSVGLVLFGLYLMWAVLTSWIDKALSEERPEDRQVSARSRTLLALFRNSVTVALIIFGGMTLLSELGLDIAPLLAGAGVIGLAVGFGAQKLVQDIITGIFIQLENAINEGDVVTVAGITGGVEKLTIRSVGIRDLAGVYHIIPFSAVDTVGNYMRRFAFHVEVVGVAYDADLDAAKKAMFDAYNDIRAQGYQRDIIGPLEYQGVIGLADSSVNLRARIKTKPGMQWSVGRAYTAALKKALNAAGVEIPFPHRELKLPKAFLDRLIPPEHQAAAETPKLIPRPPDGPEGAEG